MSFLKNFLKNYDYFIFSFEASSKNYLLEICHIRDKSIENMN